MPHLLDPLLRLLFPPKCLFCGKLLQKEEQDLCNLCRIEAPLFPNCKTKLQFLDSFTAVWYYEGNVRHSLLRYKFYGRRSYAAGYGRFLALAVMQDREEGFDLLTWVPISKKRKLRRGYDQVQLIASSVGKYLDLPPVSTLKKIRHNQPQSSLVSAAQRRANVLGAYQCIQPELVKGKRILLLDDILTTGATAGEAARVLKTMGAKEVHCAAVAAARKD